MVSSWFAIIIEGDWGFTERHKGFLLELALDLLHRTLIVELPEAVC
jgi:hypothetical protein